MTPSEVPRTIPPRGSGPVTSPPADQRQLLTAGYLPEVATGGERDEAALADGLRRWVAAEPELVAALAGGTAPVTSGGPWSVTGLVHAEGGMANETLLLELGPGHPGVAVRLAPLEPTFPGYDLAPQALVQNTVAAAGVPAPAPAVVVDDAQWIGAPFLVMPRVSGDVPGPAPLFDPYVRDAGPVVQRLLHDELLEVVAAIHAVDWKAQELDAWLPGTTVRQALARWEAYVAWAGEGDPLPALSRALDWCAVHLPAEHGRPVLLWGDVRLGNLVLAPDHRVRAVLDWDLASIGPPEMDLGWHFGLEFMMEALFGDRPPGFPPAAEAVARFERHSGRPVHDLAWHEVFALVRALAVNDRHQRITGDPRRRANPMGDVLLARIEAAEAG